MTTKEFLDKAIQGGWNGRYAQYYIRAPHQKPIKTLVAQVMLDPLAWQAVAKSSDWGYYDNETGKPGWYIRMHCMIDARCEGKSIEEFLTTL